MRKAVFLDRDGVLIKERGEYTWREEDAELNEGVVDALKALYQKGYILIVVTNQGGIAKGLYKNEHVHKIHKLIADVLTMEGVKLKDIFWCPHHPVKSNCLCRKPGSLLLEKAMALHKIDANSSYFIGDMERDMQAAENAGVNGILVPPNSDLNDFLYLIK